MCVTNSNAHSSYRLALQTLKAQLAEAGFLVLQPNYRGSTGYNARFLTEIYTQGCHWFPRLLRLKRAGM
jgi:dipeptidyl aminopeptidase/acylaminoacyl peptidase